MKAGKGLAIQLVIWIPAVVLLLIGLLAPPFPNSGFGGSSGWLSAGLFSAGVVSAGLFSVGVFSAGLFSVGVFSAGIFSVGIFSFGTYVLGLWAAGRYLQGRFKNQVKTDE
jgi:hypothetical protein